MSVYKRNGKWYCYGYANDKRYNRACRKAKNKTQAKKIEQDIINELNSVEHVLATSNETFTLEFMMQRYVDVCIANNKTYKKAITQMKYFCQYFGKDKDIHTIKPYDMEKFKADMISLGKSKATINRYLSGIRRAYNILITDDLINYNPLNKVENYSEDNRRYRYLLQEEWDRLEKVMPDYVFKMVKIALLTGLRKSNVLKLCWEQIDFNLMHIEVLKQDNKGSKKIYKPITDELYKLFMNMNPQSSGYLFVNPKTGKPYTNIRKSFISSLKKAKIEGFIFHDLRRTVGTWLLENGVDIRNIQAILDHSDVRVTERYLAITPEARKKAMNYLDYFFKKF